MFYLTINYKLVLLIRKNWFILLDKWIHLFKRFWHWMCAIPVTYMYFWLNYCDENHIERIPIAVKDIDHLFLASEIIKTDNLHLFLLSDGTRIDDNEYLESLENGTELIVCTEEQIQKLSVYFELKRYLSLKNTSHLLDIDYFFWYSKTTLMFIEAVISGTCPALFKVFLNSLCVWLWTSEKSLKRVRRDNLNFHHKQFIIIYGRI